MAAAATADCEEQDPRSSSFLANVQRDKAKPSQLRSSRIPSVGELVEKKEQWTVFSGSQSLSAALNDPTNRELDLFTRTWGSYFVPTASLPPSPFPSIEVTDFMRYLRETSAGRKIHRAIARQLSKEENESCWSPSSPGEFPPLISQLQQDGRNYDVACVPKIFLQSDFSLEDPPTFLEVLPLPQLLPKKKYKPPIVKNAEPAIHDVVKIHDAVKVNMVSEELSSGGVGSGGVGIAKHQSLKLLHEKLTHYLDVIEVHLAYQISQRSDVFFSTLSSQQELQSYIMEVRQEVIELRHKLRQVSTASTQGSLQLFNKCRRHQRFQLLCDKLELISTVQQTQPTIQLLLRKSDFVGALDLITTTQEVLQQELHGVHALRHLGSQLAEMENVIEKMMEADLVEFAIQDIRYRLEVNQQVAMTEEGISESEERLGLVVMGLLKQGKFHFLAALRESLTAFLKAKVKGILSGYLQGERLGEEPSSLAECMRGMEFEAWLDMLMEVFDRMLQCQKAVQGCIGVIAEVCRRAGGMQSTTSSVTTPHQPSSQPSTPHQPSSHPHQASSQPSTPYQPFSQPSTPLTSLVPFPSSQGLPPPGLTAAAGGEGSALLEQFEASTLAQEAEDRLAQLLMDEELSDARLIGEEEDKHFKLHSELAYLTSEDKPTATGGYGHGEESGTRGAAPSKDWGDTRVSGGGHGHGEESGTRGAAPSKDWGDTRVSGGEGEGLQADNMVTNYQPTHDPLEIERLEQARTVASAGRQGGGILSAVECQRMLTECHDVMFVSCQLVHARCAKILNVRARAGLLEDLVPTDFLALVHQVEDFVRRSAAITGVHCLDLRVALQSQAKNFLENFHDNSKKKLSFLLEGERWKQADVPMEIQGLVSTLDMGVVMGGLEPSNDHAPPSGLPPTKFLLIHGSNFAVVGTVLLLVKVFVEYCRYADSLPVLINEVMTKLIDIIKFFNSRTCELVLGAGALNAVGLKSITARHLAIMMRCLQAVCLLIPDLKKHFELRLEQKQHVLLSQFDTVMEDFSSHCNQINSKFMMIMDDIIQKSLAKWEVKQPIPSPAFRTITKQIVKLHENLVDILPSYSLKVLFTNIEVVFRSRLKEQLFKLHITNNGSTKHGIVNSELHQFAATLSSLDNVSAFGSSLFDVWTSSSDGRN